jgi:hypothetical protein
MLAWKRQAKRPTLGRGSLTGRSSLGASGGAPQRAVPVPARRSPQVPRSPKPGERRGPPVRPGRPAPGRPATPPARPASPPSRPTSPSPSRRPLFPEHPATPKPKRDGLPKERPTLNESFGRKGSVSDTVRQAMKLAKFLPKKGKFGLRPGIPWDDLLKIVLEGLNKIARAQSRPYFYGPEAGWTYWGPWPYPSPPVDYQQQVFQSTDGAPFPWAMYPTGLQLQALVTSTPPSIGRSRTVPANQPGAAANHPISNLSHWVRYAPIAGRWNSMEAWTRPYSLTWAKPTAWPGWYPPLAAPGSEPMTDPNFVPRPSPEPAPLPWHEIPYRAPAIAPDLARSSRGPAPAYIIPVRDAAIRTEWPSGRPVTASGPHRRDPPPPGDRQKKFGTGPGMAALMAVAYAGTEFADLVNISFKILPRKVQRRILKANKGRRDPSAVFNAMMDPANHFNWSQWAVAVIANGFSDSVIGRVLGKVKGRGPKANFNDAQRVGDWLGAQKDADDKRAKRDKKRSPNNGR